MSDVGTKRNETKKLSFIYKESTDIPICSTYFPGFPFQYILMMNAVEFLSCCCGSCSYYIIHIVCRNSIQVSYLILREKKQGEKRRREFSNFVKKERKTRTL
jgi:hypothetical protein